MYSRNVPAMDITTAPVLWDLTNAQWMVYYWLVAHSKRNPNGLEDHCFIYRNSFTLIQIRRDTGIKTDPTVRSALARLCEVGAMSFDPTKKVYTLGRPQLYVPMNAAIIKGLLAFNRYIDAGTTITAFAILCRLARFSEEQTITFTKKELGGLLGLARQNVDEAGVVLMLHLFKGLELVNFNTVKYTNSLGVQCIRYVLLSADPKSGVMDDLFADDIESDKEYTQRRLHIEELWGLCRATQGSVE